MALPLAHTCFFTIDLPEYSSLETMTNKVRYAIENCTAIDTDGGTGDFDVENDEESSDEDEEY